MPGAWFVEGKAPDGSAVGIDKGDAVEVELYDDKFSRQGNGVFVAAESGRAGREVALEYVAAEDSFYHWWMMEGIDKDAVSYHLLQRKGGSPRWTSRKPLHYSSLLSRDPRPHWY